MRVDDLLRAASPAVPEDGAELIRSAYLFSQRAHEGQLRLSGKSQFTHVVSVAAILVEMGQDAATLCAALLHDAAEDTPVTLDEIKERFGDQVAFLVEGVTKLPEAAYRSRQKAQAENLRRMLLSVAEDVRVILIKLADRLHNMRTISALPQERRHRMAEETLDVYAPLAHRLGMGRLKWELEDLSFKELYPEAYRRLAERVREKRQEREKLIRQVSGPLQAALEEAGLGVRTSGRPKHLYSIFRKIQEKGKSFEEIHDLLGVRVITETIPDCYRALGVIHSRWPPVPGRFKDYVALPKSNMYRALHTTVVGPGGRTVEVQIRSEDMECTAEDGIAAHWHYKEADQAELGEERYLAWLRRVMEWQRDITDPSEFMRYLRMELSPQEVFVFTPAGEVKRLPRGATALDFAFHVHTEVGLRCSGAIVDGKMVALSQELQTGQSVKIVTSPRARPSHDWLEKVRTGRARSKIRGFLRSQQRESLAVQGRNAILRAIREARIRGEANELLGKLADLWGEGGSEELCLAVADGRIKAGALVQKMTGPAPRRRRSDSRRDTGGISWNGLTGVAVRHARCCRPIPGDQVVGLVTRGRGMSIHRADCANVQRYGSPERLAQVEWRPPEGKSFAVTLSLEAKDRRGLLSELAAEVSAEGADIGAVRMATSRGRAAGTIGILVRDVGHLRRVVAALEEVPGISRIRRRKS
jgi:guanosine-3',5'-bis(diphosphate) 3'-pyrophosphohydrolase